MQSQVVLRTLLQHHVGVSADEGVARHILSTLHRFQQKAVGASASLWHGDRRKRMYVS